MASATRPTPSSPAAPLSPWHSGRLPPSGGAGAGTWACAPPITCTLPAAPAASPPPAPMRNCRAVQGMQQSLQESAVTPAEEQLGMGRRGTG